MKRIDFRIIIGGGLILLGVLMLLERFGLLRGASDFFWGVVLLAGGSYFLYRFANNIRGEWWAVIPGSALAGLGADSLLSGILGNWGGFLFLGCLGVGFLAIYFSDRERWWALIPGGILVTLALVSVLNNAYGGRETGGFFFLGLGLTFLVLAVLASMQWAYIPGVVLLIIGALVGAPFNGAMNYIWPATLIIGGMFLILQFIRRN
jgi:hypothetical protein